MKIFDGKRVCFERRIFPISFPRGQRVTFDHGHLFCVAGVAIFGTSTILRGRRVNFATFVFGRASFFALVKQISGFFTNLMVGFNIAAGYGAGT